MKKKKPSAPRHLVTLGMILTRRGGRMRDRRARRPLEVDRRELNMCWKEN